MRRSFLFLFPIVFFFCTVDSQAQFRKFFETLGLAKKDDQLDPERVALGLKEALRIGTQRAVESTGTRDGFFKQEAIKILMPQKLQKMERVLRVAGLGTQLDEFVLSMNRAAETASPKARQIFWNAIRDMTIVDAHGILTGGETAATDYFREKTTDGLTEAFSPVVTEALDQVGVTRQYKELLTRFQRIPFMSAQQLDLDAYVVEHTLHGIFFMVGQEETRIRRDPAARATDLLREVFGL